MQTEDQKLILLKDKGLVPMTCEKTFIQFDRFVHYEALKFKTNCEVDELYQLACHGFIKAYKAYDASKGVLFMTFAARCIQNEILMDMRKEKRHNCVSSLNVITFREKTGNELTLESQLSDDTNYEELAINNIATYNFNKKIDRLLNCLDKTSKKVVILSYFTDMGQGEIGKKLGLSQSYISRNLDQSISMLHKRKSRFNFL